MGEGYIGDDGGRAFERVAAVLRARMTDGFYPLNSVLPPQRELAEEFGVSRDTVQRVFRGLSDEGWIESRQGRGSRVVRTQKIHSPMMVELNRQVTFGQLINRAFEGAEVVLDVHTLTSESLDVHIRLQAERIRARQIVPQRIALRLLLPADSLVLPYWRSRDGAQDQLLRERFLAITRRSTTSLHTVLRDLQAMDLVPGVEFEIRRAELVPYSKLYLFDGAEAVHGLYQVFGRRIALEDGREVVATDVAGLAASLTHHVKDDDPYSQGTVFVESMQSWFDSVWDNIASP